MKVIKIKGIDNPRKFFGTFTDMVKIFQHEYKAIYKKRKLRRKILLNKEELLCWNLELEDTIKYIEEKKSNINVFNHHFVEKYKKLKCVIEYDEESNMFYIVHNDKRLYYPSKYTRKSEVYSRYLRVCMEQDINSAHRYLYEDEVLDNAIIFDCGTAEASFSLDCIEKVKHVYLFEADETWNTALKKTFEPWEEKVTLINRFVGIGDETTVSLKEYILSLVSKGKLNLKRDELFIKMDIEGSEEYVTEDLSEILRIASNIRMAVCAYHKFDAEKNIKESIPDGYSVKNMPGFMLWIYQPGELEFPYFRRGVLRIGK